MNEILTTLNQYSSLIALLLAIPGCGLVLKAVFYNPIAKLDASITKLSEKNDASFKESNTEHRIANEKLDEKLWQKIHESNIEHRAANEKLGTELKNMIATLSTKTQKDNLELDHQKDTILTLKEIALNLKQGLVKSFSPLGLTEDAKAIANKLNAQALVTKYADSWMGTLNIPDNANKMLIQESCLEFCHQNLMDNVSESEADVLMDAMFEYGDDRTMVTRVFGILLRNYIFTQRGIKIPASSA